MPPRFTLRQMAMTRGLGHSLRRTKTSLTARLPQFPAHAIAFGRSVREASWARSRFKFVLELTNSILHLSWNRKTQAAKEHQLSLRPIPESGLCSAAAARWAVFAKMARFGKQLSLRSRRGDGISGNYSWTASGASSRAHRTRTIIALPSWSLVLPFRTPKRSREISLCSCREISSRGKGSRMLMSS